MRIHAHLTQVRKRKDKVNVRIRLCFLLFNLSFLYPHAWQWHATFWRKLNRSKAKISSFAGAVLVLFLSSVHAWRFSINCRQPEEQRRAINTEMQLCYAPQNSLADDARNDMSFVRTREISPILPLRSVIGRRSTGGDGSLLEWRQNWLQRRSLVSKVTWELWESSLAMTPLNCLVRAG